MTIFLAIVAFCVIIIVHELGHFLVAKAFKMNVYEFSIGMGPAIFKKRGKKTDFTLRLLPIGGSVQLGEDEESEDPNAFVNKPVWQRMLVIVAGAVMNIVLGLIVCAVSILSSGRVVTSEIGGFYDNSLSDSFLQKGDKIVSINGLPIWSDKDISYALQNTVARASEDDTHVSYDFVVDRNGQVVALDDVQFKIRHLEDGEKSIYLDFFVYANDLTFGNVAEYTFRTSASYGRLVLMSLLDLIRGNYGLNDLSGPIGVVSAVSEIPLVDIHKLLSMITLITINIGIFNLLPIPALDGARFLFLLIEAIRRKPVPPKYEGVVHLIGFGALMILMLVVTFNDIVRVFTGG